jgi:CHAT domain-containing protein/predicted negative regulator of RcsB-dependent stress response
MKSKCKGLIAAVLLLVPSLLHADENPLPAIGRLLISGHGMEARAQLLVARDSYGAQGNTSRQAISTLLLGVTDYSLADIESARMNLNDATARFSSIHDSFGAWFCLWILSCIETDDGSSEEAVALHERQLALLREAADPKAAFSFETLKSLGAVFGAPTEALGTMTVPPELIKPILLLFAQVLTHDAYGHTLVEMGELEKAEQHLDTAASSAAMFGGFFDSSIAAHIGDLRRQQWRLDEARENYRKALAGLSLMPAMFMQDGRLEVRIARKLADLELLAGHLDGALAWNDRALKLVRAAADGKRESLILEDRGNLLLHGGRSDAAVSAFHEAAKLARRSGDVFQQASIHSDVGMLRYFEGNYGAAARELEDSIELFQIIDRPYVEAMVWMELADVHMMLGAHHNVSDDLERARALARKSGFKLAESMVDMVAVASRVIDGHGTITEMQQAIRAWWDLPEARALTPGKDTEQLFAAVMSLGGKATPGSLPDPAGFSASPPLRVLALTIRGKMSLDRGDYEQARASWQEALTLNPNRDQRAGLLGLIGATRWKEGQRDEAIRNFGLAADTIEAAAADVKVEELMASYLGADRRAYYDLLIAALVKQGQTNEAFAQAERARARAFLQLVGNHRLNADRGADANLSHEAETVRARIVQMELDAARAPREQAARIAAELPGARRHYASLMTRVKVSNPEYAALTSVEPLEIDAVRAQLPPDATMITYFVSPNLVHAWVIDRAGSHYATLPVGEAGLKDLVCWAERFGPPHDERGVARPRSECTGNATAEEAFAKLIEPLRRNIAHARLIIVPHGVLHYIPFAALRNAATGRYLIEDYTLTYVPSASALRFLREKETPVTGTALVLGNPETPLGLASLPGAEQEAIEVAQQLGTKAHLGADAGEALLDHLAGKIDVVHLAAHGLYDPANPLFSRIALAADATHDGSLTVHEILSSLDLTGVNLVVLSACRSAAGARSGGDEVVGLTRALLYAGTPGVISTLWNIDDAISTELMGEFYRRFTRGESATEALRQAQLFIRHSEDHSDPRFWAAFTLNGDPQACWIAH